MNNHGSKANLAPHYAKFNVVSSNQRMDTKGATHVFSSTICIASMF